MRRLSAGCLDGWITPREFASHATATQAADAITGLVRITTDLPASGAAQGVRREPAAGSEG